jgi:roadblock/LC7 domain-containing protein
MMQELEKISKNTTRGPIEKLFNKCFPNKKYEQKINISELLNSCDGDKEKLRQKLIKAKCSVFTIDFLFTTLAMGAFPFINNEITQKSSGQAGFSAEMSMANKEFIEKRADNYEKTKHKRFRTFVGITCASTILTSLIGFAPLISKNSSKFVNSLKNNSKLFDYNKGIYMSRLPLAIVVVLSSLGFILFSRNRTEQKDLAIRNTIGYSVFFGGDLILSSLFTNISDRVFGTKLRKESGNKSVINKIFPKIKSVEQVIKETEQGKLSKINKKVAAGIFWSDMLLLMCTMGYAVPTAINKMIKNDVEKDLQAKGKNNIANTQTTITKPPRMEDFINHKPH